MDLGALSDTVEALHELRNEAESQGQRPITNLCDALIAAYERLEDHPLSEAGSRRVLRRRTSGCSGCSMRLPPSSDCPIRARRSRALAAVQVADAREEELDLSEARRSRAAVRRTSSNFPTFVRPQPTEEPAPVAPTSPRQKSTGSNRVEAERTLPKSVTSAEAQPEHRARSSPPKRRSPRARRRRATVTLPPDADPEILEIFFEEAEELLEAIDQSVHEWLAAPDNQVHLEILLRCLHTLKGGARLAGLTWTRRRRAHIRIDLDRCAGQTTLPAGSSMRCRRATMICSSSRERACRAAASGNAAERCR